MKRNIRNSLPSTGEEEWQACREPLMSGWLTQGPKVAAFEKAFAERHRVKHALAVTGRTTGLHQDLAAMGIGPGNDDANAMANPLRNRMSAEDYTYVADTFKAFG